MPFENMTLEVPAGAAEKSVPGTDTDPARNQRRTAYRSCKPWIDLLLATTLLVLSAPVVVTAALLVKLTSRGPAFYSQIRLGQNSQPYTLYKIRTMFHECESRTGARWAAPRDPRITLMGGFLRRTHVDELPQLWNVLRGEMSLIGPRPERPEFVPMLERAIPLYRDRLLVRPGLTGLAQVQFPPDSDLDSVRRKLSCDLFYVRHVGLWLDVRILFCTAFYVMGMPTPIVRKLFRIPRGQRVETGLAVTGSTPQSCTALAPCLLPVSPE